MKRSTAILAAAFAAALLCLAPARAEEWPARPVRVVNTFAAGGAADILARLVADALSKAFHQQFFVETRAGAGGVIGIQSVINTPPDGYNFVLSSVAVLALDPSSKPRLGFDPNRDLVNIAYIAGSPVVLSVNPASGMKSLADFIARAKASDKPLTYSSSGVGSMGQLVCELFARKAGIKIELIPYKGASQGLADLLGGHIAFSCQTLSSTSAALEAGTLLGLAHTGKTRIPDYPAIPTFTELGYPDIASTVWFSLSAPAGLPADIAQKVNREIVRAMTAPQAQERLRQLGVVADAMTVADFNALIARETSRWKPVIEQLGLVEK
ncbi:MAG TPA: tripartite tricarboxylate transporter substrate binding protein [Xanthobacteraceae bacterium]|nr:tripartite tricarboxylate transporter substrate binding protein [Xanthobacteraceae bacterium]